MKGALDKDGIRKNGSEYDIKVEIIIPTLNEESTIGELIQTIRSQSLPIKISTMIIDGGSTDKTIEICKKENVRVIRQRGKGKGIAMREAVEYSEADIIVFVDGDGTYYMDDLNSLLDPILTDKAEMVVGSRILGKRAKGSISTFNVIGNNLFNRTINFAMKANVTDSLTGFRAMKKEVFKDLVLFSDNFEIEVEMTVEALAKGYRILEVPIRYGLRKESKTKLNPLHDGLKIARTLLFITMNVNPLKFFCLIAVIFCVAGCYPGGLVLYEKITTGEVTSIPSVVFSALLFMTGSISLVVGLVSELVVRSRRRIEYLISKKL